MKLFITIILLTICTSLYSQDYIKLTSGKSIKKIEIYSIEKLSIQYIKNGSLHDLIKEDIKYIMMKNEMISFDENGNKISSLDSYLTKENKQPVIVKQIVDTIEKEITKNKLDTIELDSSYSVFTNIDTTKSSQISNNDSIKHIKRQNTIRRTELKMEPEIKDKTPQTITNELTNEELYELGLNDSKKYYKGADNVTAGTVFGLIPFVGIIPTAICSAIPPPIKANVENPNLDKLKFEAYRAGYKKGSAREKVGKVWKGYGFGSAIFLSLFFISVL